MNSMPALYYREFLYIQFKIKGLTREGISLSNKAKNTESVVLYCKESGHLNYKTDDQL